MVLEQRFMIWKRSYDVQYITTTTSLARLIIILNKHHNVLASTLEDAILKAISAVTSTTERTSHIPAINWLVISPPYIAAFSKPCK